MNNSNSKVEEVAAPDVKKPAAEDEITESELTKVSGGGFGYGNQDKNSGA